MEYLLAQQADSGRKTALATQRASGVRHLPAVEVQGR